MHPIPIVLQFTFLTMKNRFLVMMTATVLLLTSGGCTEKLTTEESLAVENVGRHDNVSCYREQARMGDAEGYRQLARCYHDGDGVEHDFLMMWQMLLMVEQYDSTFEPDEFIQALPADDSDRLLKEAMDAFDRGQYALAQEKADLLAAQQHPDAAIIRGAMAFEDGNEEEALRIFREAADNGSLLSQVLLDYDRDDQKKLQHWAPYMPSLYCQLARECFTSECDLREDEQAASYYRLADSLLCLDATGVRWLLGYSEHMEKIGRPVCDRKELERLRILTDRLAERH